ncbi:hypothetical protein B0H13DRAFT_2042086 [Mycena leptocephala]|nr:hypothetical protein B0H13DRAFT_2042086 [Mycena leptocephala]
MTRRESTKPFFDSSLLRGLSLSLHLTLVALHVLLIAIWAMRLEHQLVFPIDTEKNRIISLVISTISTSFVTIYAALLVFVTQTLWMRRSMQLDQTLTATHDHAAAWAGIGAAISCIQHQKALPASIGGIVSIFLYLGNILVLHITIPAVLSLATFKFPISSPVGTNSLPDFNRSLVELSITNGVALLDNSGWQTATSQLYFLPTVVGNGTNLGLYGSTLFDVLDINRGTGNTTVSATGFSFSCGYPTNINSEFILDSEGSGWWDGNWSTQNATGIITIPETQPGMIASFHKYDAQSVMLYSTIPIIDSNGTRGPLVSLHPPMNTSISTVQLLQCSYTIVNQTAVVDAQSNRIQTVEPDLGKSPATWHPYTRPTNILTLDNVNIFDVFPFLYYSAPVSDIPRDPVDFYTDGNEAPLTVADLYLAQKLNLFPLPADTVDNLLLTRLMIFRITQVGHLPPIHQNSVYCGDIICFNDTETPFILLRGTASRLDVRRPHPGRSVMACLSTNVFIVVEHHSGRCWTCRIHRALAALTSNLAVSQGR